MPPSSVNCLRRCALPILRAPHTAGIAARRLRQRLALSVLVRTTKQSWRRAMKKTIACLSACTALFAAAPYIVHAADDAMVQKANAAWDKTFNSGDAKKLASLYDENAVVSPG